MKLGQDKADQSFATPVRRRFAARLSILTSIRSKFILIGALGAACAALLVGGINYISLTNATRDTAEAELKARAHLVAPAIRGLFDDMRSMLLVIANSSSVRTFQRLQSGYFIDPAETMSSAQWKTEVEELFLAFLSQNPHITQIRLVGIENGGRELVRVDNYRGFFRPTQQDDLQYKGDRPYFRAALGVDDGDVYFSPVEMNEDNGVEDRNSIVIRALTPIFGEAFERFGFIVINAHFGEMISRGLAPLDLDEDLILVTRTGDYLQKRHGERAKFVFRCLARAKAPTEARLLHDAFAAGQTRFLDIDGVESALHMDQVSFSSSEIRIGLHRPLADLLAIGADVRNQSIVTALLAALLAVLATGVFSARLSARVASLVDTIEHFHEHSDPDELPIDRKDEIGAVARSIAGMVAKISALRRAEKTALDRMRTLRDKAQDSLMLLDQRGEILDFNLAATELSGFSKDEVIGRSVTLLMPLEAIARHDRFLDLHGKTNISNVTGTMRVVDVRRKDGVLLPVELRVSEIDVDGRPVYNVAMRDVSQRRAMEKRVDDYNSELMLVSQITAMANAAQDSKQALTELVDLISAALDWPVGHACIVDDMGVLRPADIWYLADPDRFAAFYEASSGPDIDAAQGLPLQAMSDLRPVFVPDFSTSDVYLRGPVAAGVGLTAGLAFPITHEKKVVAVLEFFGDPPSAPEGWLMNLLAQVSPHIGRVFERERVARHIMEAKETAERANRAKSTFLANMSHELRTPLNAIIGFAELLTHADDKEVAPEPRGHAKDILSSGRHLLDLINDLLDTAKIEAGRFEIRRTEFPILNEIENMAKLMRSEYAAKDIKLDVTIEGMGPNTLASADRRAFRQIVLNLLSNALKFTPPGRGVSVFAAPQGTDLRLVIADEGVGIAQEDLAVVFEPFVQSSNPAAVEAGGTGIGLPLSRTLAELHGGRLNLESSLGAGTKVTLELPTCLREAAPDETVGVGDLGAPKPAAVFVRPPSILVAEDHPVNQMLMRTMLARIGCDAAIASDGIAAVEAAQTGAYDLIFMDIQMPRLDGIGAAQKIRALPGDLGRIPIVALSANVQAEHQDFSLSAGMNDHLGKPVTQADIRAALERWLPAELLQTPGADADTVQDREASSVSAGSDVSSGPAPDIDQELAADLIATAGADVLAHIVETLAEDFEIQLSMLRAAVEADDFSALRETAHRLKGSFGGVAGRGAANVAHRLQSLAEIESEGADALIAEMADVGAASLAALRTVYSKTDDAPGEAASA